MFAKNRGSGEKLEAFHLNSGIKWGYLLPVTTSIQQCPRDLRRSSEAKYEKKKNHVY